MWVLYDFLSTTAHQYSIELDWGRKVGPTLVVTAWDLVPHTGRHFVTYTTPRSLHHQIDTSSIPWTNTAMRNPLQRERGCSRQRVEEEGVSPGAMLYVWRVVRLSQVRDCWRLSNTAGPHAFLESISYPGDNHACYAGLFTACGTGRGCIYAHSTHDMQLLTSHLGEPGSSLDGVAPGFSHMGTVPDNVAGQRVFSWISRFPRPCIPGLLHTHLTSISSTLKASFSQFSRVRHMNQGLFTKAEQHGNALRVVTLNSEVLRADEGEARYGVAPECKGGVNGISPRKPADQWNRPARFSHANIQGLPHRESKAIRLGKRRALDSDHLISASYDFHKSLQENAGIVPHYKQCSCFSQQLAPSSYLPAENYYLGLHLLSLEPTPDCREDVVLCRQAASISPGLGVNHLFRCALTPSHEHPRSPRALEHVASNCLLTPHLPSTFPSPPDKWRVISTRIGYVDTTAAFLRLQATLIRTTITRTPSASSPYVQDVSPLRGRHQLASQNVERSCGQALVLRQTRILQAAPLAQSDFEEPKSGWPDRESNPRPYEREYKVLRRDRYKEFPTPEYFIGLYHFCAHDRTGRHEDRISVAIQL
ncbi:hypothetical protein PR048_024206 [Dryococelus australis]|uniref:C3H1-type domain-containing protein n=1 Tax=Dryococelus australis TaxID=614101 RepID=A0ABQ9GW83_9NEOP|nr:hypothetical protein PR048_024206 [Dryococelus australis]